MNNFYFKKQRGVIITYVLVFGTVFLILLGGLFSYILSQLRQSSLRVAWNEALNIAESGIDYYQWCLNNNAQSQCPTTKNYYDSSGNLIGKFSLDVTSFDSCGQTVQKKIISTGWTNDYPDLKRKISVIYARESVAKYSYILNDNVWIGSDHKIRGPYSSNGGIRMDGQNQSLISSAKSTWACTSSFGCSSCPTSHGCSVQSGNCVCPGVFTTTDNSNQDLFDYPVPPFDFAGITVDLAQMKAAAISSGVYLPPSKTINSNGKGYYVKFINNGTFEVWIITGLSSTYGYSLEDDWQYDYFTITSKYLYNTYQIPSSCSAIFMEDNVWPEGQVKGKVILASANLIDANLDTSIVLPGNITYANSDGSDGLALIAEKNLLIGPQSPDNMELHGIFVAQKGRFSRNHYPNNFKDLLEIYGSVISNGRVGTQWTSGSSIVSGYTQRESYYDSNLVYAPPPFVPYLSPDFKIVKWDEVER